MFHQYSSYTAVFLCIDLIELIVAVEKVLQKPLGAFFPFIRALSISPQAFNLFPASSLSLLSLSYLSHSQRLSPYLHPQPHILYIYICPLFKLSALDHILVVSGKAVLYRLLVFGF